MNYADSIPEQKLWGHLFWVWVFKWRKVSVGAREYSHKMCHPVIIGSGGQKELH